MRQADGEFIGLVSVMINVTSEERYHRLFENLSIGIFRFLKDEGLIYANEKFLHMHGYARIEEIYGAPVSRFVEDKETARLLIEEVRREGKLEKLQSNTAVRTIPFSGAPSMPLLYTTMKTTTSAPRARLWT